MWKRTALTAILALSCGAARAEFSIICDEKAQVEDILDTTRNKGFEQATSKFRAYLALRDERNEPTCEVGKVPHPAKIGPVVAHFKGIEFLPEQLHDVLIVEVRVGERTLYGTLNQFVAPKAREVGL